jgi:hypothetical protein
VKEFTIEATTKGGGKGADKPGDKGADKPADKGKGTQSAPPPKKP